LYLWEILMFRVRGCLAACVLFAIVVFTIIVALNVPAGVITSAIAILTGAITHPSSAFVILATVVAVAAADRPRHLTRRQIPPFLLEKLDLPLGYSTLCKECADGNGPTPAFEFGIYLLYTEAEVIRWALARCRPVPAKADSPAAVADTEITPRPKRGRPPRKTVPDVAGTAADPPVAMLAESVDPGRIVATDRCRELWPDVAFDDDVQNPRPVVDGTADHSTTMLASPTQESAR
jgi:hypothetical protein